MPLKFPVGFRILLISALPILGFGTSITAPTPDVVPAINSLGLDLYREQIKSAGSSGVLLSPYSVATALAMTYTGADGATKAEMEKVLHLPSDQTACGAAFEILTNKLETTVGDSLRDVARMRVRGGDATPLQLTIANRLIVQEGYSLQSTFIDELRHHFHSEIAELDFQHAASHARNVINQWVAQQTKDKIRDLLPANEPEASTRLMLLNVLYMKAAWADEFSPSATRPEPFHLAGGEVTSVPTMQEHRGFGYVKHDGHSVVTLPFVGRQLQLVLFVPDENDGLASLEKSLTAQELSSCAKVEKRDLILHLPKFKLEPGTLALAQTLQSLGLSTAFDQPKGSANFNRMVPRKPNDYLAISDVFHKTWLVLDEHGVEAAAATEVQMVTLGVMAKPPSPPLEVRVDHPFLFAIQHIPSGACLFLGRVTDPR